MTDIDSNSNPDIISFTVSTVSLLHEDIQLKETIVNVEDNTIELIYIATSSLWKSNINHTRRVFKKIYKIDGEPKIVNGEIIPATKESYKF